MEKELYTINKEAKRLRDENSLYYQYIKPDSYVPPIIDTLSDYSVAYDKQLIDLGLIIEIDNDYYPYYAVHDVITILIEYAENWGKDDWGLNDDEIEDYIADLNAIKYDINYCPRGLMKTNKQKIAYLYDIKEKTLVKLLNQKKAKVVGVHSFDFTIKGNVYTDQLALVEYNNFYFHLKNIDTELIASFPKIEYISSKNKLKNKISLDDCIKKLEDFVFEYEDNTIKYPEFKLASN